LALAFAFSIALHEIVAGAIPPNRPQPATREIVSSARLVRIMLQTTPRPVIATPQPAVTPTPLPAPTAQTHLPVATVTHVAQPTPHRTTHIPPMALRTATDARPVWDTTTGTAGGTLASAAGKPASASGTTASGGNGNAAQSGEQPCGFVTFSDPHGSHFDAQTRGFWVDIRMSVHLADGSSQSVMLDYSWYYPSEAANPWSDANLRDPNFPTRFQTPPPSKIGGEPPLVQYVVAHSTPNGMTLLRDCPAPAAPSR
jgi:hypothetical protein